ncbi:MAG: right-handed parallel beta-helix repeat-containing protein, partial [Cyclobacteriaceae bacterium]|nr:right-handed parallel beta-helix repeat-containing protein [Cyclobacteriaceae bacterium]
MKKLNVLILAVLITAVASAKEYHVSKKGSDTNDGSTSKSFKTISAAVNHAFPGDIITVHEGVYREWINPVRGGESDAKRIVYRAASGEKVEIKGSEIAKGWEKVKNGVWKVIIDNSLFGDYNPYQDSIYGDWFNNKGRIHHTGEVFLNGKSLYEKETKEKVFNPIPNTKLKDSEGSTYTWYCESDANSTTIWANFHKFNPNKELVEISARRTCIYPEMPGINYITISGFHISQAATQWGAPTAEQIGMIATHWNKCWIIEDNVISNSKCSGITLGKDRSTGHNVWSADKSIDGSIHYIEVTFRTLKNGWSKENIGSHIVRNNRIFACEQTGICGSMGAAFSTIENNHIYNIWTKRQFDGAEIGGIKFHAAIDATISENRINDCGRGLWLDWMTQGTRVS